MARAKFGALLTELRGKIGGSVFQGNKYGFTMKNCPIKTNSNSGLSLSSRLLLAETVRAWGLLPSSARDYFNNYAVAYPQFAKHNLTVRLSGYSVFSRWYNVMRLTRLAVPSLYISESFQPFSYSPTVVYSNLSLIIDLNADQSFPDYRFAISASLAVPAQRFGIPNCFRYVGSLSLDAPSSNFYYAFLNVWGEVPVNDYYIFLRVVAYHTKMPWVVAPSYFRILIS